MTVAVCLTCGEIKVGAWTECPQCGCTPEDEESMTKHLLATDHYLSREDLERVSTDIKAGKEIAFDPASLEAAWVDSRAIKRLDRGCLISLIAAVLAVVLLIYLVFRLW